MTLWDSVPSLDLERSWDSNPLGSTTTADKPCLYALEPKMGLETPCFDGLSTSGLHSARFPAILSTYPERDFLTRTLGLSVSLGDLVIGLAEWSSRTLLAPAGLSATASYGIPVFLEASMGRSATEVKRMWPDFLR